LSVSLQQKFLGSNSDHKPLEIAGFREAGLAGMISWLAEVFQELNRSSGVASGAFDYFPEKLPFNQSAAREGEEHASGIQKLERQQVDVLVGAQALWHFGLPVYQFRGVKNNEIKTGFIFFQAPERLKCVSGAIDPFGWITIGVEGELPV
jgi:hypothetical protein